MTQYSHSKLQTFEQCPYKYKLRYIDKIKPPIEATIEALLGSCVHNSLEWMYSEVLVGKIPELDQVIEKYASEWESNYTKDYIIVKKELTSRDYFDKGVKFLIDYYIKHHPFDEGTIELEKKVHIDLGEDFEHTIVGYIDRLAFNNKTGEYEIHDYKTANTLPNREKFENDRQLALYSIAIKEIYGDKPVKLIWHYLNYNIKITSKRTNDQLEILKKQIKELIIQIENTKEFPTRESMLCNWCEYKSMCPLFKNKMNPIY